MFLISQKLQFRMQGGKMAVQGVELVTEQIKQVGETHHCAKSFFVRTPN